MHTSLKHIIKGFLVLLPILIYINRPKVKEEPIAREWKRYEFSFTDSLSNDSLKMSFFAKPMKADTVSIYDHDFSEYVTLKDVYQEGMTDTELLQAAMVEVNSKQAWGVLIDRDLVLEKTISVSRGAKINGGGHTIYKKHYGKTFDFK